MKWVILGTVLVLAIMVTACSDQSGDEVIDVVGTTWQWQEFLDTSDENGITVDDPSMYTLTLVDDGTANVQADCNQLVWTYEMDGNSLKFDTAGPSTLAFCGEESLDEPYLLRLSETASYAISDGKLHLNMIADAGNLVFSPAE